MTLKNIAQWLQNSGNAVRDRSTTNWNTFQDVKESASTKVAAKSAAGEKQRSQTGGVKKK